MIYEHSQYLELPMTSSYTPSALEFAVRRDRVEETGVCMLSPGRACPRGRAAWGAWRPVALGVRGPGIRKGRGFEGGGFWKRWAIICYYWQKIITKKLSF